MLRSNTKQQRSLIKEASLLFCIETFIYSETGRTT